MATAANAAYGLFEAFRIRCVEMWAPPSSTGAATTVAIEEGPAGSALGNPSRRISDVTMGQSRPAHVRWVPQRDTLLANWITAATSNLLLFTGPTGTTIDIHLSYTLRDNLGSAVSAAVAGATTGQVYVRSLNSNGGNNIVPVSYSTI
jgi:hypothetical protein